MIDLDIVVGTDEQRVRLSRLRVDIQDRVLVRVLNRTAFAVRAEASRRIRDQLKPSLSLVEVRKAIRVLQATRGNLVATVRAGGRARIPLTAFKAHQTDSGVSVKVGTKRYDIPHAFIARVGRARKGVRIRSTSFHGQMVTESIDFRRKRIAKSGPDYPISEIFAPGISQIFIKAEVMSALRRMARERASLVLAQELRYRNG